MRHLRTEEQEEVRAYLDGTAGGLDIIHDFCLRWDLVSAP